MLCVRLLYSLDVLTPIITGCQIYPPPKKRHSVQQTEIISLSGRKIRECWEEVQRGRGGEMRLFFPEPELFLAASWGPASCSQALRVNLGCGPLLSVQCCHPSALFAALNLHQAYPTQCCSWSPGSSGPPGPGFCSLWGWPGMRPLWPGQQLAARVGETCGVWGWVAPQGTEHLYLPFVFFPPEP